MTLNQVIFLLLVPILGYVILRINHMLKSPDEKKSEIIAELEKKGLELVEIRVPKLFDTGPFPKFRVSIGPQVQVLGHQADRSIYRVVTYRDKQGNIKESWVRISITAFVVSNIEWNPKL